MRLAGFFFVLFVSAAHAEELVLENFQTYSTNTVPDRGWKTREGDANGIYRFAQEGENKYLEAKSNGQSVQLFRDKDWDIKKYPILHWKWRVHQFPAGANEAKDDKNDSAAGVYVIFPRNWFIPEAIKYVWSEVVPKETIFRRRKQFATIVIRTGRAEINEWQSEERNVREDYEKIFGRSVPRPVAFGFLTDGNDTHSKATADYDDISVRSK